MSNNRLITNLHFSEETQRSLYNMAAYGMSRVGRDAEAFTYFSRKVTYGQLMDDIHACAAGLLELGCSAEKW